MKLKKMEITIIAVTLAFACFTGGFFAGRRTAVNIVSVQSDSGDLTISASKGADTPTDVTAGSGETSALPPVTGNGDAEETAEPGVQDGAESPDGGEVQDETAAPEVKTDTGAGDTEPSEAAASPSGTAVGEPYGGDYRKIDINSASKTELTDLPGIGDVLAGRIIEYREKNGKFRSIEDIKKVSGIGDKKFEAMKDLITVG